MILRHTQVVFGTIVDLNELDEDKIESMNDAWNTYPGSELGISMIDELDTEGNRQLAVFGIELAAIEIKGRPTPIRELAKILPTSDQTEILIEAMKAFGIGGAIDTYLIEDQEY